MEGGASVGDEVSEDDADGHGEEDPESEEAVKDSKALEDRRLLCGCSIGDLLLLGVWVGGSILMISYALAACDGSAVCKSGRRSLGE